MAKANRDPLDNLDEVTHAEPTGAEINAIGKHLNDLHEHLVRLQKQVNDQQQIILSLQESINDPTTYTLDTGLFEAKVWETVMVGALSASLGPNKILQDTPKAMQQMIGRALRLADSGVVAAKAYQQEQELQKKDKEVANSNDPLRQLMN
tara:strand:- start:2351 stop:2800 length:450 start_codon:yes stop_codon:yes gene_type:complete